MFNVVLNRLLHSTNKSANESKIGVEIGKDIVGISSNAFSAIETILEVGGKVATAVKETVEAFKKVGESGLDMKKVQIVPTAVENLLGKHYVDTVCPDSETDRDSEMDKIVQEIGKDIIKQSDRTDLEYKIRVKKDAEVNSHVLPGGKIVITTGLLKDLQNSAIDHEDFRTLVAGTVGYLVGTASESQPVKQMEITGLFAVVKKVIGLVTGWFTPVNTSRKITPEEKKNKDIMKILENSVDLGEKIVENYQGKSADQKARELSVQYCAKAGYLLEREELDDILDTVVITGDPEEKKEEIIDQMFKTLRPLAAQLIV